MRGGRAVLATSWLEIRPTRLARKASDLIMYRLMGKIPRAFLFGALAAGAAASQLACAEPLLSLESDTPVASAGYYQLRWETGDENVQLVEATNPRFSDARIVYAGPDTARIVSGKPDGDYYYRLETNVAGMSTVVSDMLKVTVEHHSLDRAFAFFGVGAAVFAATLGLILIGGRNERG